MPDPTPVAVPVLPNRPVVADWVVIVATDGSALAATADASPGVVVTVPPVSDAFDAGVAVDDGVAGDCGSAYSTRAKVDPEARTADRTAAARTPRSSGIRRRGCGVGLGADGESAALV